VRFAVVVKPAVRDCSRALVAFALVLGCAGCKADGTGFEGILRRRDRPAPTAPSAYPPNAFFPSGAAPESGPGSLASPTFRVVRASVGAETFSDAPVASPGFRVRGGWHEAR
jgi:hypothetical protein